MVERRSFEITPFLAFAENIDYSHNGDLKYTDKPPGTGLWAAPFYAAARLMPVPTYLPPGKHDAANPRVLGVGAAVALAGALAVGVFWHIVRRLFEIDATAAGVAALALAFGTAHWKYSSVLYPHATAALGVLTTTYLALSAIQARELTMRRAALVGAAIGATVLMEYTTALFGGIVGLALLAWCRRGPLPYLALAAGGAPFLAFLLLYNWINFGSPLDMSTFRVQKELWPLAASGFATTFSGPLLPGLRALLVWGSNNQGVFLLSPIALLAIPGFWLLGRSHPREAALCFAGFVVPLLLVSKHINFNPLTNDSRYLVPYLGLLMIPVAFAAQRAPALLTGALLAVSVQSQLLHIAFSWNYDLKLASLQPMAAAPANVRLVLKTVFPNAANVWWLWLLSSPALVVALWASRRR